MNGDSKVQIDQCLSCKKVKCTNCLDYKPVPKETRIGRPNYPVKAFNGGTVHHFPSVHEAASFADVSVQTIRNLIKSGKCKYGYYWGYDNG